MPRAPQGPSSREEWLFGSGVVSRQFRYVAEMESEEHIGNGKLKSSPITQLMNQIVLSHGHTLDYEYDAEERIPKVTDSVDGAAEYTCDAWDVCTIPQDFSTIRTASITPYRYRSFIPRPIPPGPTDSR